MNFAELTNMFLNGILEEDTAEFNMSLKNLKSNGIYGRATSKGIVINYNNKKYNISTDCSDIPDELKKFEKDIKIAFQGKTHGSVERVRNETGAYHTPDPYKVGHRAQFLLKK